jgi:hypothetical protein
LGHGDNENRLIPTVVQRLADSHSVQSVACGGYHMAAIAITSQTNLVAPQEGIDDDDDEDEDVFKYVSFY